MILLIIITAFFLFYACLIIFYWQGWKSIPLFRTTDPAAGLKISVIIPARNEEKTISHVLNALTKQDYPAPLFEIIVVDDHSEDNTAGIVRGYPGVKLIQPMEEGINSYKKKALETGIAAATGDFIITTDADCIPGTGWLRTMAAFKKEKNAVFIAAPVMMEHNNSFLQVFQSMDFMILQGITGASVFKNLYAMCNGANLGYDKNVFYEVNGFKGVDHIASGDDMLLMEKIRKQYPGRVHFLKSPDAIVSTAPMETWPAFFNQRIRWASKTLYYRNAAIMGVLFGVYFFNLSFLALCISGIWHPCYFIWLPVLWLAKTGVELPFYISVSSFFRQKNKASALLLFQPMHIIYTLVSGIFSQFGQYEWKGRRVK